MPRFIGHLAVAFLLCVATAQAQQNPINHAKLQNSSVVNSTVDSTPIGQSSPSTGNFTSAQTGTLSAASSATVGTVYSQFQLTPGSAAPVRRGFTWSPDPSGDVTLWLNTVQNSPSFTVKDGYTGAVWGRVLSNGWNGNVVGGTVAGTTGSFSGPMSANSLNVTNGASIGGTLNTNSLSVNGGAIIGTSGATIGGTINTNTLSITGDTNTGTLHSGAGTFSGNVTAPGFLGSFVGGLNGNASTASALASNPPNCSGANVYATGIQANGSADCAGVTNLASSLTTPNGYVTLPGGIVMQWGTTQTFDTGPVTISFPVTFPHACLNVSISDSNGSSSRRQWGAGSWNASNFQAVNDGNGLANWFAIGY